MIADKDGIALSFEIMSKALLHHLGDLTVYSFSKQNSLKKWVQEEKNCVSTLACQFSFCFYGIPSAN